MVSTITGDKPENINWGEKMKGGIESLSWVNDKNGKEYVCYFENDEKKLFDELTGGEQKKCVDVNQFVGTERW